jgi:hypothetical protein
MNHEVESYEGELKALRKSYEILRHIMSEKLEGVYFICGEGGEKDSMNLPKTILVCPAYGLDGFAIYTKTSDYSAPGY